MIDMMVPWGVAYVLHSTAWILAAALVARLAHRRPELVCAVWKLALVGGIVTASLQVGLGVRGPGSIELATWMQEPERVAPPVVIDARELAALEELAAEQGLADVPAAAEPVATAAQVPATLQLAGWLVLLGSVLGLVSVLVAAAAVRVRLRGRVRVGGDLDAGLQALRVQAGVRLQPSLWSCRRAEVPMATGVLWPTIVVPPRVITELGPDEQQAVLAHELAHLVRRDPLWRLIGLFVERVLFFQPLNRLANEGVARSAEYLCDDWAARQIRRPLALARGLTEIAGWIRGPRPALASAMAAPPSLLRSRVLRLIESPGTGSNPRSRRWWWAAVPVPFVAAVLAMPSVSWGNCDPPPYAPRVVIVDSDAFDDDEYERGFSASISAPPAPRSAEADEPKKGPEARKAKRRTAKARRRAETEVRRAFADARREHRAAPDEEEIERILRRANRRAGQEEDDGQVSLRIELSNGLVLEVESEGFSDAKLEQLLQALAQEQARKQKKRYALELYGETKRAPGRHGRGRAAPMPPIAPPAFVVPHSHVHPAPAPRAPRPHPRSRRRSPKSTPIYSI